MSELYDRPIPDLDQARLRAIFKLQGQDLPTQVIRAYWDRKVVHDRYCGGESMSVDAIFYVAEKSGIHIPGPDAPTLPEQVREGEFVKGDMVEVQWRDEWILSEFRSVSAQKLMVVMEGQDRRLPLETPIRKPEPVEA